MDASWSSLLISILTVRLFAARPQRVSSAKCVAVARKTSRGLARPGGGSRVAAPARRPPARPWPGSLRLLALLQQRRLPVSAQLRTGVHRRERRAQPVRVAAHTVPRPLGQRLARLPAPPDQAR